MEVARPKRKKKTKSKSQSGKLTLQIANYIYLD